MLISGAKSLSLTTTNCFITSTSITDSETSLVTNIEEIHFKNGFRCKYMRDDEFRYLELFDPKGNIIWSRSDNGDSTDASNEFDAYDIAQSKEILFALDM